jgi:hypothetical protein
VAACANTSTYHEQGQGQTASSAAYESQAWHSAGRELVVLDRPLVLPKFPLGSGTWNMDR